jgi:hypothetical protein
VLFSQFDWVAANPRLFPVLPFAIALYDNHIGRSNSDQNRGICCVAPEDRILLNRHESEFPRANVG